MAKQLKKEAIEEILNNPKLFSSVCDLLNIKPGGLMSNLNRNSVRLCQHEVVIAVAGEMGLIPADILEEKDFVKVA
jgi:hypothetical protein